MKILNGSELAGFIKERQAKQVRSLRQSHGINPKLVILQGQDDPVINTYVRLKKKYGEDIQVDVDARMLEQADIAENIKQVNADDSIHGMILQLPLKDPSQTQELLDMLMPEKDVDGLANEPIFDSATPTAIRWLLDGYNVDLNGKKIVIVGKGKLVGSPLLKMYKEEGRDVEVFDRSTTDMASKMQECDVVISATGKHGLITANMLKHGAVAVDAGVAVESGKTIGDFDDSVYERDDLTLTPKKGGVGPLTVSALFENVIRAAQAKTK